MKNSKGYILDSFCTKYPKKIKFVIFLYIIKKAPLFKGAFCVFIVICKLIGNFTIIFQKILIVNFAKVFISH